MGLRIPYSDNKFEACYYSPVGEEITTLGRSYDENYLYVGTYNPARSGKKGSLYIYDFATQNLVKSYEGIVDKPVKILYKYRM